MVLFDCWDLMCVVHMLMILTLNTELRNTSKYYDHYDSISCYKKMFLIGNNICNNYNIHEPFWGD